MSRLSPLRLARGWRAAATATACAALTAGLVSAAAGPVWGEPGKQVLRGAPQTTSVRAPGQPVPIAGWSLQSSAQVKDAGEQISRAGYPVDSWYRVPRRSTVLGGLVQAGKYGDLFHSTNLRDQVNPADFDVDWWFRSDFEVRRTLPTFLRFNGLSSRADLYVNGTRVADRKQVVGAYAGYEFDVTKLVRPGRNSLALSVAPAHYDKDLGVWFLDWTPKVPGSQMGIWRDVEVVQSTGVSLRDAHVTTTLAKDLTSADVTVKATVRNDTAQPARTALTGRVTGPKGTVVPVRLPVELAAGETRNVSVSPEQVKGLHLAKPAIWWPYQLGRQPRYRLELAVEGAKGKPSDTASVDFGIRSVTSHLAPGGGRQFVVNGRPTQIRAAGYASDIFLRYDHRYVEQQMKYWKDLGLNAIRLEGKQEHEEFYDLADRNGMMILSGWECCDKWEGYTKASHGEPWTEEDFRVAGASMLHEAQLMRNHPSVAGFYIGSDNAPTVEVEKTFLDALKAADWDLPVIPSAARKTAPISGPSGMKMDGPYDYVPPNYWYGEKMGAAFGFGSELGSGVGTPELDSLRRFLTAEDLRQLWQEPDTKLYHMSSSGSKFATRRLYHDALEKRYGKPASLEEYLRLAQAADYEATRAQFEGYASRMDHAERPATGLVYWMLNGAWPTLHWQLYDRYLGQGGAYYGAKKGNEQLHVMFDYGDRKVTVVNHTTGAAEKLTATAELYNPDGTRVWSQAAPVGAPANRTARAQTVPAPAQLAPAHLLRLVLTDAKGRVVSRNAYLLSTKADVLDWAKSDWWYTPQTQFADFSSLRTAPKATVVVEPKARLDDGRVRTTVVLRNVGRSVALFQRVTVRDAKGQPVAPITWSDNYLTLAPGETVTVTGEYRLADAGGKVGTVQVTGWNTGR